MSRHSPWPAWARFEPPRRGREKERERDRERGRERETDRQTDRQREREGGRETDREREGETLTFNSSLCNQNVIHVTETACSCHKPVGGKNVTQRKATIDKFPGDFRFISAFGLRALSSSGERCCCCEHASKVGSYSDSFIKGKRVYSTPVNGRHKIIWLDGSTLHTDKYCRILLSQWRWTATRPWSHSAAILWKVRNAMDLIQCPTVTLALVGKEYCENIKRNISSSR